MQFEALFKQATTHEPYPFQTQFATAGTLPNLLRAPTGSGKTATAVLAWLWRRRDASADIQAATPRRLIFCLPMRTLVHQTHTVIAGWLERLNRQDIGLHSLLGGAIDQTWEAHPERDTIIIGTQDQLLSRALNRGYSMSRYRWPMHFALLNNDCLWIMDEVQLMGVGLSTSAQLDAFRRQQHTFGPSHSVWMSATLDAARLDTIDQRQHPQATLQLSSADHSHPALAQRLNATKPISQTANAITGGKTTNPLAQEILTAHQPGTRTLVVLNRVAHAQDLYQRLIKLTKNTSIPIALLHSRYRPPDRQRIQAQALAPGFTGIIVSTQTIEAGVDLDARLLFTALARWDAMVQRFGRCNRAGTTPSAQIRWIDLPDKLAAPYTPEAFAESRSILGTLTDASPAQLRGITRPAERPTLPILRRRDLQGLFDTTPDLSGFDLDVGQYIRETDDADVALAWRPLDGPPGPDDPALHRDELCRVPIGLAKKLLKGQPVWRWDRLSHHWLKINPNHLPIGRDLLVGLTTGGYHPELGLTGNPKQQPFAIEPAAPVAHDADDRDALSHGNTFVTLDQHAADVAHHMRELQTQLPAQLPWHTLIEAARQHDWGKAHQAFQQLLLGPLSADDPRRDSGPWAKSDHRKGKNPRRFFRHELASALAILQQGGDPLTAYLVLCHHGKVRTSIRPRPEEIGPQHTPRPFALGVWQDDPLPAVHLDGLPAPALTLSLDPMRFGPESWATHTEALLDNWGPFRLAYLETLVRIADWRGTAARNHTPIGGLSDG
jgi:CRISPR-associated endonuclease/helicase Cas3